MKGRTLLAATGAGLSLSFAFPEADLAPLAWISIAPLLVLARDRSPRAASALGFVFGLGFFGSLIIWIKYVGWIPWAVLVVMEAFFIALFAATWSVAARRWGSGVVGALIAGALWVTAEWVRSLVPAVGFTWGQLAQSQTDFSWLLRASGLAGGATVSLLLVAVNALIAQGWVARRSGRSAISAVMAMLYIAAPVIGAGFAFVRPTAGERSLRVAIVQGNVDRDASGTTYDREIARIERHAVLTRKLDDEELDLVVWPESSVGTDAERDRLTAELLGDAARSVGVPMIVGANLDVDEDKYMVVALLVSAEGEIVDRYQKTHLVPFGEYIPARNFFDWIPMLEQVPRDAVAGNEPHNFEVAGVPIATVISFEGDFGPLVRDRVASGGRVVVVATNTSTWGDSWASSQHLAFSRVRAAENGVPVIHAALSGVSAFVEPDGEILGTRSRLYKEAVLIQEVTPPSAITPYARSGDWLPLVAAIIGLVAVVAGWRRPRSSV